MTHTEAHLEVFDSTLQKTNTILNAIKERFNWDDRERAYLALRAVLQTLRDRLTPAHVAGLGAQLPILVRGIYYEGWQPAHAPLKMSKDEFIWEIENKIDALSYEQSTEEVIKGVIAIIQAYTDPDEIRKIKGTLPKDIRDMFED